jgi:RNA polymerase sigma factor (TIGR02999 family)
MSERPAGAVTQMLRAAGAGDRQAAAELLPMIYSELHKLAQARMSKTPPGNTLQPTALVHEAYLRLVGREDPGWNSRGHFFAAAAQAMRQILVEQARRKSSDKHGGGRKRVDLQRLEQSGEPASEDLVALNEALEHLEQADPRKARVVMLRYFAGLTNEETAEALGISVPTVEREWRFSRSFLYTVLADPESGT